MPGAVNVEDLIAGLETASSRGAQEAAAEFLADLHSARVWAPAGAVAGLAEAVPAIAALARSRNRSASGRGPSPGKEPASPLAQTTGWRQRLDLSPRRAADRAKEEEVAARGKREEAPEVTPVVEPEVGAYSPEEAGNRCEVEEVPRAVSPPKASAVARSPPRPVHAQAELAPQRTARNREPSVGLGSSRAALPAAENSSAEEGGPRLATAPRRRGPLLDLDAAPRATSPTQFVETPSRRYPRKLAEQTPEGLARDILNRLQERSLASPQRFRRETDRETSEDWMGPRRPPMSQGSLSPATYLDGRGRVGPGLRSASPVPRLEEPRSAAYLVAASGVAPPPPTSTVTEQVNPPVTSPWIPAAPMPTVAPAAPIASHKRPAESSLAKVSDPSGDDTSSVGTTTSEAFALWSLTVPRRSKRKQGMVLKTHSKDAIAPQLGRSRRSHVPARLRAGLRAAKARAQAQCINWKELDSISSTVAKVPCFPLPGKNPLCGVPGVSVPQAVQQLEAPIPGAGVGRTPDLGGVVLEMSSEADDAKKHPKVSSGVTPRYGPRDTVEVLVHTPHSETKDDPHKPVLEHEDDEAGIQLKDIADFCRRSRRWLALAVCVVLAILVILLMCMMLGLGPWHCHGSGRLPKECEPLVWQPNCTGAACQNQNVTNGTAAPADEAADSPAPA